MSFACAGLSVRRLRALGPPAVWGYGREDSRTSRRGERSLRSQCFGYHQIADVFTNHVLGGLEAICAGFGGTQIWDVSDPLKPVVVSTIYNPLIQFSHYAVASKDGKILVINDENITANDCVEQDAPTGAIWVYDISDVASPKMLSYFGPPRGNTGSPLGSFWVGGGTCTSHDFNFVDNRTVTIPWYTGGFNVISLKDPPLRRRSLTTKRTTRTRGRPTSTRAASTRTTRTEASRRSRSKASRAAEPFNEMAPPPGRHLCVHS